MIFNIRKTKASLITIKSYENWRTRRVGASERQMRNLAKS